MTQGAAYIQHTPIHILHLFFPPLDLDTGKSKTE